MKKTDQTKMLDILDSMRKRLKRRNILLDEVRTAYLKDVVIVRELLSRQEEVGVRMTTSLNLRPTLALYAPSECTFRVAHGGELDKYGGHLEVVHHESKRVVELSKRIEELLELEQESRFKAAKLDLRAQQDRMALVNQRACNRDEREQLCNEIQVLKDRLSRIDETAHETLQRTVYGLQRQLDQAEGQVRELLPLVSDSARNQQEAGQTGLQLVGKDQRIADLEKQLTTSKFDLTFELDRYNDLEAKFTAECDKSLLLQRMHDDIVATLEDTNSKRDVIQGSLDESRRSEAELQQKLSDLRVEYTEAIQREEAEQEELQVQLEQSRAQERIAKNETDDINIRLVKSEHAQQNALTKACADVETKLEVQHVNAFKQLNDDIMRFEDKSSRTEAKLKIEQEKRTYVEAELHSLRVEGEQQKMAVSQSNREVITKVTEILVLIESCPHTSNDLQIGTTDTVNELETVRSQIAILMTILNRSIEEKQALELHLEQYKAKTGAISSSAKLISAVSHREGKHPASQDQLVQMLQENADGLSQLQTELDFAITEKEHVLAESKLLAEALKKSQTDLNDAICQNVNSLDHKTAALVAFRIELLDETKKAKSCTWPETSLQVVKDLKHRVGLLEEQLYGFHKDAQNLLCDKGRVAASIERNHPPTSSANDSSKGNQLEQNLPSHNNLEDDEINTQHLSAVSLLGGTLEQLRALKAPANVSHQQVRMESTSDDFISHDEHIAQVNMGNFTQCLEQIASKISGVLMEISAEICASREVLTTLPEGFSYKAMVERMSILEQTSRESVEGDQGKKGGREEELQRLKQRNASQQNFIMELQEEVATMKGLMFAADEIKRQYSELEDKYRLLENEFTEKAENEVNSRKAKERIELQLTLAHADVASLSRDKSSLMDSLNECEDVNTKLESKLAHALRIYEDVMQRERSRLETNRDVQTQFNPTLIDIEIQTSFKTPTMTLRQINSYSHVPHRRWGPGTVTPAVNANHSMPSSQLPHFCQSPHVQNNRELFQDKCAPRLGRQGDGFFLGVLPGLA